MMSKQGLYEKQECNVVGILNMEGNSPIMEINGESVNLLDILRDFDGKDLSISIGYKKESMTE